MIQSAREHIRSEIVVLREPVRFLSGWAMWALTARTKDDSRKGGVEHRGYFYDY